MGDNMQFKNLQIRRIIIHEIFKRNLEKEVVEPRYSHTLSQLDDDGIEVLTERVINAVGSKSNSLEMEINEFGENSCIKMVDDLLENSDEEFIEISKNIAYKLAVSQNSRRIPGGVVVVFDGTIGLENIPICGVIKAEIHSGFTRTTTENNDEILKYLSDLLLTPQQKLYKIAIFVKNNIDIDDIRGMYLTVVYDHNMKKTETKDAASYFYDNFLGCTFKKNSKLVTKNFYEETKAYINGLEISDEEKIDLNLQLYSYVKSPINSTISIEEFAENSLKEDLRDSYSTHMMNKDIPTTLINKDTQYLEQRLKQRKIKFSNEISIIGPSEKFNDSIKVLSTPDEQGSTTIKINGKIQYQQ